MTGLSGLMTYVELMQAAGLRSSVERHVRLRERGQGWTDSQMIISLMLLNLAGGESVSDLDLLEKDRGLCRMLREFETCGMRLSERRALEKRWRVERRRSVPGPGGSPSRRTNAGAQTMEAQTSDVDSMLGQDYTPVGFERCWIW